MEIKNNNVTNVNPPVENQAPQPGSKAKKKASSDAAEFDASVMAAMLAQTASAEAGKPAPAATKVELSGKNAADAKPEGLADMQKAMLKVASAMNQAQANAVANASAKGDGTAAQSQGQLQFPDANALIQTQAKQDASGTMTEALVAGPNQPWSPNWVFGANKAEIAQSMEQAPGQSPLAGIMSELSRMTAGAQGGDAKSASAADGGEAQALGRLNQELGAALSQLSGEVASAENPEAMAAVANQPMNRVGGEAFLGLLNGAQGQSAGGEGQMGNGSGNGAGAQDQAFGQAGNPALAKAAADQAKSLIANAGSTTAPGGLHVIEGGKAKGPAGMKDEGYLSPEMLVSANAFAQGSGSEKILPPQPQVLTGHVVPGSMMRERLTSETVSNMTSALSNISAKGGNGEMQIRMNPGNLGELMIKVTTQGNLVGLKVSASDPQAKKILEESLSSLKDGLAAQNLSLSRVDISITPPSQSSSSNDTQSNLNHHQANSGSMNFDNGTANSGQQGSEARNGSDASPVDLRAVRAARALSGMNSSSQPSARNASGRLNVIA